MVRDVEKELWEIAEELKSWGTLLSGANDLGVDNGELNGLGLRLNSLAKQLELIRDEID